MAYQKCAIDSQDGELIPKNDATVPGGSVKLRDTQQVSLWGQLFHTGSK